MVYKHHDSTSNLIDINGQLLFGFSVNSCDKSCILGQIVSASRGPVSYEDHLSKYRMPIIKIKGLRKVLASKF